MNITIKKRDGSPDFVLGSFGLKLDDLKQFVNDKGYVNFDILKGKYGNYIKVNEYKPKIEPTQQKFEGLGETRSIALDNDFPF